jgi:bacterioferritin-associated ferredoxin
MLICHCKRVCDRIIRETVRGGAESVAEVGRMCGAGTGCGGCQPAIDAVIEQEAPVAACRTRSLRLAS